MRHFILLQVKAVALNLADMESFLKRRQIEDERLHSDIQEAFSELSRSIDPPHTTNTYQHSPLFYCIYTHTHTHVECSCLAVSASNSWWVVGT